jgi:hypothetical protein
MVPESTRKIARFPIPRPSRRPPYLPPGPARKRLPSMRSPVARLVPGLPVPDVLPFGEGGNQSLQGPTGKAAYCKVILARCL